MTCYSSPNYFRLILLAAITSTMACLSIFLFTVPLISDTISTFNPTWTDNNNCIINSSSDKTTGIKTITLENALVQTQRLPQSVWDERYIMGYSKDFSQKHNLSGHSYCKSQFFPAKGDSLRMVVAGVNTGETLANIRITLQKNSEEKIELYEFFPPSNKSRWLDFMVEIPDSWKKQKIQLGLDMPNGTGAFLAIPSTEWTEKNSYHSHALTLTTVPYSPYIAAGICSLFFAGFIYYFLSFPQLGAFKAFLILFIFSFGLQFRPGAYFFWDEWHVMMRFIDHGFGVAFLTHSEHFIPLFMLLYFAELKIFGGNHFLFLIVSVALLSTNALLLSSLLTRISKYSEKFTPPANATLLLVVFYVTSGLHSETMHWAFTQCILLSLGFILLSLIFTLDFLETGKRSLLALSSASCFVAPLFFANGLATCIFIGLFLLFVVSFHKWIIFRTRYQQRSLQLICSITLILIISLGIYMIPKPEMGHKLTDAKVIGSEAEVAKYVFVGSQHGTILRSTGIYPSIYPLVKNTSNEFFKSPVPEINNAYLGSIISITLLLIYILNRNNRQKNWRIWMLGQGIIIASFLLPAAGRWHFGIGQSLSPRYQTIALIGLIVLFLPAANYMFSTAKNKLTSKAASIATCSIIFFLQLAYSIQVNPFSKDGLMNRSYIERLQSWKKENDITKATPQLALPPRLSPGFSHKQFGKIADELFRGNP